MKNVSIVIPVYNEVRAIDAALRRVYDVKIPGWKKEIIVVDDGSTDGTKKKLKAWEKKIRVVFQAKNQGKGAALVVGFKHAQGDIILVQDADMEYSPENYQRLLDPFANDLVDIVYGSRFLGPHLSTMFVYELGNKFVTLMTNLLYNTNITDMETGYKVFRRGVLESMQIRSRRFDFEPEFTAKALKAGYQIYEVPISYYGRKFEEGKKLTWKDGIAAVWALMRYRFTD